MRAPGVPNAWGHLLSDDYLSPEEKLGAAIVLLAIKDLSDPRASDEDYTTAAYLFEPSPLYDRMAAEDWLDLSDSFLETCQGFINGRKKVPVQVWLW